MILTDDSLPITYGRTATLLRFVHNSQCAVAFEFTFQDSRMIKAWKTADKIFLKSKCPRCEQHILINDLRHLSSHFGANINSKVLEEFMLKNFRVDDSLVKFERRLNWCCKEFNQVLYG